MSDLKNCKDDLKPTTDTNKTESQCNCGKDLNEEDLEKVSGGARISKSELIKLQKKY